MDLLLKYNANIQLRDNNVQTQFHWAALNKNQKLIKSLFEKYPDLANLQRNDGKTFLYLVCEENEVETLRFLFDSDFCSCLTSMLLLMMD